MFALSLAFFCHLADMTFDNSLYVLEINFKCKQTV